MDLDILNTLDGYRRHFMDLGLWETYVRKVVRKHFAAPARSVRPGIAGTYPTFIVDDRWVIKFFGFLFNGALSFETELRISQLLQQDPAIPAPPLIAKGELFTGTTAWPWPYLIFEFIPGVSFGEIYDQISLEEKLKLAARLGEIVRRIHRLPLIGNGVFEPSWDPYLGFLRTQRQICSANHRAWGSLPRHLVDQIDKFLLPVEALMDLRLKPHLIHADLTGDHLLGRLEAGCWTTLGLIDFGDAMVGDLFYELIALHLDLFRRDKRLLRVFLDTYDPPASLRENFTARAMTSTLLHRFDVLVLVFEDSRIQARIPSSLEELAHLLWDVDAPGLPQ